jgi:hypothetical protein
MNREGTPRFADASSLCAFSLLLAACSLMKPRTTGDAGSGAEASGVAGGGGLTDEAGSASARPTQDGRCAAGEVAILLAPGEEGCVIECRATSGCPAGWLCEGEGVRSADGKAGPAVRYCRITTHGETPGAARDGGLHAGLADAGPAGAHDAGKVAPGTDAGKGGGSSSSAGADAGKPAPGASPGPAPEAKRLDVKATGGACPSGYRTCGAVCRLTCRADADCGLATAHCQAGFCLGPGARPCAP